MAYYQQPAYNPAYQPPQGYSSAPYGYPQGGPGYHDGNRYTQPAPSRYSSPPYQPPFQRDPDLEAAGYRKAGQVHRPQEPNYHSNLRNAFLRKIYLTLCLQFGITAFIAGLCAFHRPAQLTVLSNPRGYLYGSMIPGFIILMSLNCVQHQYPLNAILLFAFTILESITLGVLCAVYQAIGLGDIVVTAAGLTAAIFIGLTVYVHLTKTDFSFLGGFLMAGMLVMFFWGLLNMIFGWHPSFVYAAAGALLSVGLILFDTSLVLLRYGYDDHIAACITLYLDVVNLFIYLLRILASSRSNER